MAAVDPTWNKVSITIEYQRNSAIWRRGWQRDVGTLTDLMERLSLDVGDSRLHVEYEHVDRSDG